MCIICVLPYRLQLLTRCTTSTWPYPTCLPGRNLPGGKAQKEDERRPSWPARCCSFTGTAGLPSARASVHLPQLHRAPSAGSPRSRQWRSRQLIRLIAHMPRLIRKWGKFLEISIFVIRQHYSIVMETPFRSASHMSSMPIRTNLCK